MGCFFRPWYLLVDANAKPRRTLVYDRTHYSRHCLDMIASIYGIAAETTTYASRLEGQRILEVLSLHPLSRGWINKHCIPYYCIQDLDFVNN